MKHNVSRVKWQCRRGSLELDLLLMGFLEGKFESLTEEEQDLFVELLRLSDQELTDSLVKKRPLKESKYNAMILEIQTFHAT